MGNKNLDEEMAAKWVHKGKLCKNGHKNGPTATQCWKCGSTEFKQVV